MTERAVTVTVTERPMADRSVTERAERIVRLSAGVGDLPGGEWATRFHQEVERLIGGPGELDVPARHRLRYGHARLGRPQ
jgi:hypothetical protein